MDIGSTLELGGWQLALWWVVAWLAGSWCWITFGGQHRRLVADRDLAWWLWHWFTGGPLETHRSFVGFAEDGGTRTARATRRAGTALGRTVVPVLCGVGTVVQAGAARGTLTGTLVAGAYATAAAAGTAWLAVAGTMHWAHWRMWVRPLHLSVHKRAGFDDAGSINPRKYIAVPRDRTVDDAEIAVGVASNFPVGTQGAEDRLVAGVKAKLDIASWTPSFHVHGRHSYVAFRPPTPMPASALYRDPLVRGLLADARESSPVIGITRGERPVTVDLVSESPHMLMSAGTGGGKSAAMRTLIVQLMLNGADVTVLDIKRRSHPWIRGIAGVRYHRDIGEIHQALCWLGQEGHRRNKSWDDVGHDEEGPTPRRHVVLFEEANATMPVLRDWWKNHRESSDPPTSPAVRYYSQLLFMGRQARMHVFAVSQMATANDMGGGAARENFNTRILGRHTKNNWNMLVPECTYVPASRHPGRVWVCIGGVATETQAIYVTEAEARGALLDQRGLAEAPPVLDVADVASRGIPASLGKQVATVAAATPRDGSSLTLRQASKDNGVGVVSLNHGALRKAAERDPEFPAPSGKRAGSRVWDPAGLQRWEINRTREIVDGVDERGNEIDGVDRMEAMTNG